MKITAKNNTTKGFLLCFRPFPMEGSIRDASTSNDSDLKKSFSVNEKPKSKVYSSHIIKESIDGGNQKKTARRVFSKIVKAVAFQSSLSKKVGNRKIIQDPLRTDSIAKSSRRRSSSSSSEENDLKIDSSISNSSISSSILSSSSSLSISSSTSSSSIASSWTSSSDSNRSLGSLSGRQKSFRSDSIEDEKKQNINTSIQSRTDEKKKKKKKISGICLLLISLFVLIFWGKVFAILCTSTWFYFVSTTRGDSDGDNERRMLIKSPAEIQSKENKKKIIMQGFLGRNHRGGGYHLHQQH